MRHFLLLLLLPSLLLFSACKKEKDKPLPPTQYMPQELKDYMLFKKNSYWVYQDSATGALDSVIVTADTTVIGPVRDQEDPHIVYAVIEGYKVSTHSFYLNRNIEYTAGSRCLYSGFLPTDFCYKISREVKNANTGNDLGKAHVFYYYPIVGATEYSYGGWVSVAAKYDSLQVSGHYYPAVVRMDDTRNGTEGGWPTRFYFSKHHGIVRKEIMRSTDRQVWNLVRHQLIQ